MVHKVVCL